MPDDPPREGREGTKVSQVRAAVLTNFEEVARFLGLDAAAMLHEAGLTHSSLTDPERMLPSSAVARALEEAARQSGCEQFGLLMAESRSFGSIGPLSLLLMHEPRVGDVIESLVRHQRLFGDAMHIESAMVGDANFVTIEPTGVKTTRQGAELALAIFCRCIAIILDRRWAPESVHFIHTAPADLRIHRRIFACPVDFGSDFNGIVCTRDALQEENPAGDEELVAHAERLLALMMPPDGHRSAADRVRRSLRLLLPQQRGTIDQVARDLAVTTRSLQRQLQREGRSFGDILDEVRRALAQQYLAASHHIGLVAHMTGYQSASSFTRWFNTQFGMAPTEWRHQEGRQDAQPERRAQ